jgi:streptogramin lyase
MRSRTTRLSFILLALSLSASCSKTVVGECVDLDHDGFGTDCARGADCNDADPNVHDGCSSGTGPGTESCDFNPFQPSCPCDAGVGEHACYGGTAQTAGVGICRSGGMTCNEGVWGECFGEVLPATETCDTIDNNCDGRTDEGLRNSCGTCEPDCTAERFGPAHELPYNPPPEEGSGLVVNNEGALALDVNNIHFEHIWIANSGENTVSKLSTETGREIGRYRMTEGCGNPSRTAVDLDAAVWVACRAGGRVVKIAAATRQCVDRNENGVIDTSRDADDNGRIEGAELLPEGADECVLFSVHVAGSVARAMAIDPGNNAWVGIWDDSTYYELDGRTGQVLGSVPAGGNPYGAAIYGKTLWSSNRGNGTLARIDVPSRTRTGLWSVPGNCVSLYGIGVDGSGDVWMGNFSCSDVVRFEAEGESFSRIVTGGRPRGIAVTADGFVFAGLYEANQIAKIRISDATVVGRYPVGQDGVIGVALDDQGFVWGVSYGSGTATKMDQNGTVVGTYPVGSGPYTYSDMTGQALRTFAAPRGIYRVQLTSPCKSGTEWKTVEAITQTPAGTAVEFTVYVAATADQLFSPAAIKAGPFRNDADTTELPGNLLGLPHHKFAMLETALISEDRERTPTVAGFHLEYGCTSE